MMVRLPDQPRVACYGKAARSKIEARLNDRDLKKRVGRHPDWIRELSGVRQMARVNGFRFLIGAAVLVAFGILLWLATRPPPLTVQGEVSSDRVDISPRVAGRIARLHVDVGSAVERNAVIAELESPQLLAPRSPPGRRWASPGLIWIVSTAPGRRPSSPARPTSRPPKPM